MPKPQKTTEDRFYDTFASWPLADQKVALKVMARLVEEREKDEKRAAVTEPGGGE